MDERRRRNPAPKYWLPNPPSRLPAPLLLLRRRSSFLAAIKIDATMFDGAAEPPPDASLFRRVESLEQGPRLHLSFIVEVSRADRILGFICSAWPNDLTVRHVLSLSGPGGVAGGDRGGRDFTKLEPAEREVDGELAEFLHDYMANKDKRELLRWLNSYSYICSEL